MISYGSIQFFSKVPPKNEKGSELAAMVPETTANEQTKPRTKRLRLDSKIKGKNIKLFNKSLVYRLLSRHNFSG
jgi:hypothetical protein